MMRSDSSDVNASRYSRLRLAYWFDNKAIALHSQKIGVAQKESIDWLRMIPFLAMHIGCFAVFWVGISALSVSVAGGLYVVRMFAITGFYHRYFSHRAFRTSRVMQFMFALLGSTAVQRGPLWWAAHHRHHHRYADELDDVHSPRQRGFFWSHMGWFMSQKNFATHNDRIKDFSLYPELRFLDRYDVVVPSILGIGLYCVGEGLHHAVPSLATSGWQLFVWGFCVSTVLVYHATFSINSLAHRFGSRRYETQDDSRNNGWLALLTLGEGWHNNHHYYPGAAQQGFYWWEIDITYYGLRFLAMLGLIWDLKHVPIAMRQKQLPSRHPSSNLSVTPSPSSPYSDPYL